MPFDSLPRLISRTEARAQGLTRYFTNDPCKHRHIAQRYVSNSRCVVCSVASAAKSIKARRKRDPASFKERDKRINKRQHKYKLEWKKRKRLKERIANPLPTSRINISRGDVPATPRIQARKEGRTRYFTGKICKQGHMAPRLVSNGQCVICSGRRRRENEKRHPEKKRNRDRQYAARTRPGGAAIRQWKLDNPEKAKLLQRAHAMRRQAQEANPAWADQSAIKAVYLACPTDHEVDHIVPLTGLTIEGYPVSGLHVPWNLQYLTPKEDQRKNKRMRPEDHILCESGFDHTLWLPRQLSLF